ncbi:transposase [Halobellus marinus]|uniref:transposase n=2 Tax=Haloferacaceae TaxID=1644056 RepID=UPI0028AC6824|nr:transposase [Halobellus sp. DFY28]
MPNPPQEFGSIDLDFSSNPELAAEFPDNSKALLMLGFELLHAKMWPMASISEQLQAYLNQGFDPAEAVGELDLVTDTLPFWKLEKNWYKLDREDAARLYLYRSLTASKDYAIEEELKDGVAEHLGLNDTVTENTIERISEEVEKQLGGEVRTEVREVLEELEDNNEVVTLPESSADGRGEPPLVLISREMRKRAYQYIQLDRDEARVTYPKWQLFKLMEIAGLCNIHPNDAEESLRFLPYFYYRDVPGFKALWNQLREYDMFKLRKMYLAALESVVTVIDEYGYLPETADIAMDLTNIMWYGRHSDKKNEDGQPLDRDKIPHEEQPIGVEGVDEKAGSAYAFQIASVSLANVEIPVTLAAKSIQRRGSIEHQIDELLTYAEHYVGPDVVCMDGGFYGRGMHECLENHGLDFISRLRGRMPSIVDDLKQGAIYNDLDYNAAGYDVRIGEEVPESKAESWLITMPSEKRISRADTGTEDKGNWEVYYTNLNPEHFGGLEIGRRYRQRWAVETSYRLMKHDFTAKSASELRSQREFVANMAFIYNAIWMASNVKYAVENDRPVKDDQGRYPFTANQLMVAMLLDMEDIDIGEVRDLSVRSNIVRGVFGDGYPFRLEGHPEFEN